MTVSWSLIWKTDLAKELCFQGHCWFLNICAKYKTKGIFVTSFGRDGIMCAISLPLAMELKQLLNSALTGARVTSSSCSRRFALYKCLSCFAWECSSLLLWSWFKRSPLFPMSGYSFQPPNNSWPPSLRGSTTTVPRSTRSAVWPDFSDIFLFCLFWKTLCRATLWQEDFLLFRRKPVLSSLLVGLSYSRQLKGLELFEFHLLLLATELPLDFRWSCSLDTKCFINCEG